MKTILILSIITFCFSAFSSAVVKVDEARKTVSIITHLVFYGKEASEANARACVQDIIKEWAPLSRGQSVYLGTKNNVSEGNYKIQLQVTYEGASAQRAAALMRYRKKIEFNYVEIPEDPSTEMMNAVGNVYSGFIANIYADSMKVPFKICAHEFGHLLGLGEMNSDSEPPSMMTQEGVLTPYTQFQVKKSDPRFFRRDKGTFDIALRKLGMREIQEIKTSLQRMSFNNQIAFLNCNTCF